MSRFSKILALAGAALVAAADTASAQMVPERIKPDLTVPSTLANVNRGVITADIKPVAHVQSGQTVAIETISHQGLAEDPIPFFATAGIPVEGVLKDAVAVAHNSPKTNGFGGHVLTGPIYIDGAEPGDLLEVRMIGFENRVPYGVNSIGPGGAAPGMIAAQTQKIIKVDPKRGVALFSKDIEPALNPFMGIMAVAPPPALGPRVSSGPPGVFGGNMDFKRLTTGATLYLPVFVPGGLFVTGDSHATQGDGEVTGNALEASLTATLQFVVHKGGAKGFKNPRAEDPDNFYVMGIQPELNGAMTEAVEETDAFLVQKYGLTPSDAYSLASIAVDYAVAEDVDGNKVIYGKIPKAMFKAKTPYWLKK